MEGKYVRIIDSQSIISLEGPSSLHVGKVRGGIGEDWIEGGVAAHRDASAGD